MADADRQAALLRSRGVPVVRLGQDRSGELLPRLEQALRRASGRDLYLYVGGHGSTRGVAFGSRSWLTPARLRDRLRRGRFPHALVAIEACNSGVFRRSASARAAVLTAARADERSFASRYDARTGEWLGNAFSDALVRVVSAHRAQSLLVAYRRIARAVSTSRPQLYGNAGGLRVDDFFGR